MVFYRKYRPQKIEELDSKEVRDKLYSVLESSSVAHAFLFTGPKGLGKTSTARIVAKVLNCENNKLTINKSHLTRKGQKSIVKSQLSTVEPCNKCEQCRSITNGTNLDILEIDGASNRGIDEIRDLREKVKLSPLAARKKVYIIDEVHMLTQEAFNALLKTLEEPPSHVVFILCTTEPHKVPATILSRCLHIQFKKATEEELVRSFERIIKAEKIKADKEALNLIAGLSDGSFRDGSKILEEIVLLAGRKKITTELVEKNYQVAGISNLVSSMIKNLEDKDTKTAFENISKLTSRGIEMGHFMQKLIETLHNDLLLKAGIQGGSEFMVHSSKLEIEELKRLIELLSKAHSELKYAILPQLPLELAIVEWGLQAEPADGALVANENSRENFVSSPHPNILPKVTQQNITGYSENGALWTALIDKVKAYNHSIAGVLRGCSIKSYDGKSLIIEANFKFHKDKLSEPKTHEILENTIKEVTKKEIEVSVVLKQK